MKDWHGLTPEEWTRIMEAGGWRAVVEVALREVSMCRRAAVEDRLNAINILNQGIISGQLLPDTSYPVFMRDALIDITRHGERSRWFGRRERRRLHARVIGAKWLLQTVAQLVPDVPEQEPPEPRRTPKLDELLS